MKDKIYTRLQIIEELKGVVSVKASSSNVGYWALDNLDQYNKDEFDDWNTDDEEIYDVLYDWHSWAGEMDVVVDYDELQRLVDKFLDVSLLYPQLIEFRKDFDDWENIDKFIEYAGLVFRNQGLVAFPLFLSYVSYFNDKDYSGLVEDDLKAIKPLEPDFCVREFINNVYLLMRQEDYWMDYSGGWAAEILCTILESAEHNKCLNKYLELADKDILLGLIRKVKQGDYGIKDVSRIQDLRDKLKDER